jgi:hypothetical protein
MGGVGLVGTRGPAGKSDVKKLSLASDIDAQGDTPSLEGRRMPTVSDGTLVFFSQAGESLDETRTPRGVSEIARRNSEATSRRRPQSHRPRRCLLLSAG